MGAPVSPIWQQQDYAFYSDGTESGSTIVGTAGSQQTLDTDTLYHCRLAVAETNGANKSPSLTIQWQYNLNGGGWTTITGTTPIQFATSGNVTDGGATTDRIGGTGTFVAGRIYSSANTAATCYTTGGNDHTEALLTFTIDSNQVSNNDEILVRAVEGDGTVFGGTYTNADINVNLVLPTRTGTLAFTEPTDTISASGGVVVSGSLSYTESQDAASFTGEVVVPREGTLSFTEPADTLSASGDVPVQGSFGLTEPTDTGAFSGTVVSEVSGTLSVTEGQDTAAIAGSVPVSGAISVTESTDTIVSTGGVPVDASMSLSEAADVLSFSGFVGTVRNAVLDATEGQDTASFIGDVEVSGSLSSSEAADSISLSGQIIANGTITYTEPVDGMSVTGELVTVEVITSTQIKRLADIWRRFGLDPLNPLTETRETAEFADVVLTKEGTSSVTTTRAGVQEAADLDTMITDLWMRLGLDPDNPMIVDKDGIYSGGLELRFAKISNGHTITRQ